MRLRIPKAEASSTRRYPAPSNVPHLPSADLAAVYRSARIGGDFFDFVLTRQGHLVLVLLDIAGEREQAMSIAAQVQNAFRATVPVAFDGIDLNETDAVSDLTHALNSNIVEAAGGVRCTAAFVGCYSQPFGVLSYVNAGHVPALVRYDGKVSALESAGVPLGLFSHITHDAQVTVVPEGAVLFLASRGVLEVRAGGEEYGLDRLKTSLRQVGGTDSARELCDSILRSVSEFAEQKKRRRFFGIIHSDRNTATLEQNDLTTVALVRARARASATAAR